MTGKNGKRTGKQKSGVIEAFSMIGQFGINMIVPIVMCSFLGYLLDKRLGTGFIVIIMFFFGALVGGYNVFRMARTIYDRPDKRADEDRADDERQDKE